MEVLFEALAEGKTISDEGLQPGWSDTMMDLAGKVKRKVAKNSRKQNRPKK